MRAQDPLSPGTVALLVLQKPAENTATLKRALVDGQPAVRAVAARVAAVSARRDLAPIVSEQLAREDDPIAGGEQVRALLVARGPDALAEASAAAVKLGAPVRLIFAEWLGRIAPAELASRLPELAEDLPEQAARELGRIVAMGGRQNPAQEVALGSAWIGAAGKGGWRAFLDRWTPGPDNFGIVSASLASSTDELREMTVWFVLDEHLHGHLSPIPDFDPDSKTVVATAAAADDWTAVGLEILARRRGQAPSRDLTDLLQRHAPDHKGDARKVAALKEWSTNERAALRKGGGSNDDPLPPIVWEVKSVPVRTFGFPISGLMRSVLDAAGCKGMRNEPFGAAIVGYRDDGRVAKISSSWTDKDPACAQALLGLAMLSVAEPLEPADPESGQWLLLPMEKRSLACIDTAVSPDDPRAGFGPNSKPPRKTRDAQPQYPEAARREKIEGIVIMEATVSPTGCVASGRVIRGLTASLNVAALAALLGWEFEPATVDGEPAPFDLRSTMNFTLR
jgi:TonB family protein